MKGQRWQVKRQKGTNKMLFLDTIDDNLLVQQSNRISTQQIHQRIQSSSYAQRAIKPPTSKTKKNQKQVAENKRQDMPQKLKLKDQRNIGFKKENILKNLVKKHKIKNIQKNFTNKIMRNSPYSPPAKCKKLMDQNRIGFSNLQGIQLPWFVFSALYLLSVIQILTLVVIYSLALVFDGIEGSFSTSLQTGSLVFYFVEILINLISVRVVLGRKKKYLNQIFQSYLNHTLIIDLISLLILSLDIFTDWTVINYLRLFLLFKLPQCLQKIQKLEVYFNKNIYYQQYWELAKVVFYNLAYAHIIALALAAMASLNPNQNWMHAKGIDLSPWNQQYAWSYYWANTIMLTVGFGDLVATNYQEATCISFIETFSCLMIAYNISCVGNIISNIRSNDQQRHKKIKLFKKLTDKNKISDSLVYKINNYIEQSSKLKKNFDFEENRGFLSQLPSDLRNSFLREAHKQVLCRLLFFRGLLDKTLSDLAEKIETRISHPQQVIRSVGDDFNLIILRKGQIGYTCRLSGSIFNEQIADLIIVKDGEPPFLTSLAFISKQRPSYEIKSLSFSMLSSLSYELFIEVFRQNDLDYELYCFLRDKIRNIPDEFEVLPCEFCGKFCHFKFSCPRLHYAPLQQNVLNKEIHREKVGRNQRSRLDRQKAYQIKPFDFYANTKNSKDSTQLGPIKRRKSVCAQQTQPNTNRKDSQVLNTNNIVLVDQTLSREQAHEIVSIEFGRLEKREMFLDEVWLIDCDRMNNFRNYFSDHNPSSLGYRFSLQARRRRQIEKSELMQSLEGRGHHQNLIEEDEANSYRFYRL